MALALSLATLGAIVGLSASAVWPSDAAARAHQLSRAQCRAAAIGVPKAAARWAGLVNHWWSKWHWKVRYHGITGAELHKALLICWRESRGLARARNSSSGCAGLFQLQPAYARGRYNLMRPLTNISLAGQLFARRGWSPWAL